MYRRAILLVATLMLADAAHAQSPGPPKLDITGACRDTAAQHDPASRADIIKTCVDSENRARKELQAKWSRVDPAVRAACIGSSAIGTVKPVYSELISCIEMKSQ